MGAMISPGDREKNVVSTPDISTFRSNELTSIITDDDRLRGKIGPPYEGSFAEADDARQAAKQPPMASSPPQPLGRQVGGNHYQKLRIQPIEYIEANGLGFSQGNVIKLVTRYRDKGGVEDLDKAIHYIEFLKTQLLREEDASTF